MYKSAFGESFEEKYITPHYVFVSNYAGKKLKVKVPSHVYNYVTIRSCGEGYLVKYRHKSGIFDVYDFVPKYEDKKFVN